MTDLTPIALKLCKLIPRLATDRDGEVAATVRAIQRTLASEGLDLYDFAQVVTSAKERVVYLEAEPEQWKPRTWAELARWVVENDRGRLKSHERQFARDMAARLVLRGKPSEKQGAWLRALHARLDGGA